MNFLRYKALLFSLLVISFNSHAKASSTCSALLSEPENSYMEAVSIYQSGNKTDGVRKVSHALRDILAPQLLLVDEISESLSEKEIKNLMNSVIKDHPITEPIDRSWSLEEANLKLFGISSPKFNPLTFALTSLNLKGQVEREGRFSKLVYNLLVELGLDTRIMNFQNAIVASAPSISDYEDYSDSGTGIWSYPFPTNITEYGADFSRKLIITSLIMNRLFDMLPEPSFSSDDLLALKHDTARGRGFPERDDLSNKDLIRSIYREGVLTINQTTSLLMAQKINEYDSASSLLEKLVFSRNGNSNGLIANASILIPAGIIGPMTLNGNYFDRFLILNEKGEPTVNPEFIPLFKEIKKNYQEILVKNNDSHYGPTSYISSSGSPTINLGGLYREGIADTGSHTTGCPVASSCAKGQKSSLQIITELFYRIYEQVDEM